MATTAAYNTFRRVYANPQAPTESADERLAAYGLLWHFYTNQVFDDLAKWQHYRAAGKLYRHTRPIYNPARRLVDFYTGIIYQGRWSSRPADMTQPDAAIPWADDADDSLLAAIGQLYQWSNWAAKKTIMLRYGAAVGDVLTAIVDDAARRKVYLDNIWPGHVADISLNPAGDVIAYVLEYDITDAAGDTYTYRREVDKQAIRTYRDGAPHSYDEQPAEIANPYGFVPAVWTMHNPTGGSHGEPALRNLSKIDEANSLAAHALDQAHRILEAPILIAGEQINSGAAAQKAGATNPRTNTGSAEDLKIVTAGAGARIEAVRLDPGEALEHVDRMLKEIEADHPEIGMYQQLRSMTQVSGPAADRLFGDVAALVAEARTQYDRSTVKLMQMAVAIAGWRARSGAWGDLDSQQAKFAPFDLDSYQRGDLDIEIQARPLILPTRAELIALERAEIGLNADARYTEPESQPARIAERLRQAAEAQQRQEAPAA
jgi:hypothetical protein